MKTNDGYLARVKREAAHRGRVERRMNNAGIVGGALLFLVLLVATCSSCTATLPVSASGPVDGSKRGTATVVRVCGLVLAGDGSTRTAAAAGGVRFVQTVDRRTTSVLGLVTWSTTIVTGE